MEHKLILGGGQWLPFARSRIKALRATGLPYASQRVVLDDAIIEVRIALDQEFIRITGGGCNLTLDSGVLELWGAVEVDPTSYNAGILHETASVLAYNAAFIEPMPEWRENPVAGSQNQLSGKVSYRSGDLKGRAPYDALQARSFSPVKILNSADPPAYVPSTHDELLYQKKLTALNCPPSIFTGRCRLYVQAMYGAPLYAEDTRDKEGNITAPGGILNMPPELVLPPGAIPHLLLAAYRRPGDETDYGTVKLDTSSGVHFDPLTNKHWLLCPSGTTLTIYPLIASSCGEKLRTFLSSPRLPTSTDREHLEAYILSTCRPDVLHKQVLTIGALTGGGWAMGYGWHWNWAGLVADIVMNAQFSQGGANVAMRSTHFRLTAVLIEGTWGAAVSVVEGPTDWALTRTYWCITEPDWSTGTLGKTTAAFSNVFACNAPFYVFYNRDTLKVCRVKVELVPLVPQNREVSPSYFASPTYAGTIDEYTYGLEGGQCIDWAASPAHYSVTFDCAGQVEADLADEWSRSGTRVSDSAKTFLGYYATGTLGGLAANVQVDYGVSPYVLSPPIPPGYTCQPETGGSGAVQWDRITATNTEIYYGQAAVVVPFMDAEAVYLKAKRVKKASASGTKFVQKTIDTHLNYWWQERKIIYKTENATAITTSDIYIKFGALGNSPAIISTDNISTDAAYVEPVNETVTSEAASLVCRAGTLPATFGSLDQFFNNALPNVLGTYATFSGAASASPAVFATDRITPVGMNGAVPAAPLLVGWA